MLSGDELKKAVPAEYFFRGQKAPVQVRNSVGFQLADGKMALAALHAYLADRIARSRAELGTKAP